MGFVPDTATIYFGQIGAPLRLYRLYKFIIFPVDFLLSPLTISIVQGDLLILLLLKRSFLCSTVILKAFLMLLISYFWVFIWVLESNWFDRWCFGGLVCSFPLCFGVEVGSDFWYLLFDLIVSLLDAVLFFFVMPLESVAFMFMVQIIDTFIIFDVSGDVFCLSVTDLLDFPQMPHVHLIPHFLVDYPSACWVHHQSSHFRWPPNFNFINL